MAVLTLISVAAHAQATDGVEPYEEFGKRLRAAEEVAPLKSDLFGDKVSLYNGASEFNVVDISVPGNGSLPVELRRHLTIEDRRKDPGNLAGFGDWDLDIPYIDATVTQQNGWVINNNGVADAARCSNQNLPYVRVSNLTYTPDASVIWNGNHLHIPGVADDEMLKNTEAKLPAMADGNTYPWITKGFIRLGCLATTANGYPGEAFVAVTTSGVRYTFNWAVVRTAPVLKLGTQQFVTRSRVYLLVTRIDDRFGNWVTYSYNGDQLTRIAASDGRTINVNWSGSTVASVTSAAGIWSYGYINGALSSVAQPDGSAWNYSTVSGSMVTIKGGFPDDYVPPNDHCQMEMDPNTGDFVYRVGAPSGATGVFHFSYMRHYRNYVPLSCVDGNPYHFYPDVDTFFDNFALVSKQITGAGLAPLSWTYSYSGPMGAYFTPSVPGPWPSGVETYIPQGACASCSLGKVVTVTGPDEVTKYTFGMQYARNEGRLLQTETDTPAGAVVKTVIEAYVGDDEMATQAFPENAGLSVLPSYKNPMVGRLRPTRSTTTVQDGDSYTWLAETYDVFAQPITIKRFNSIAGQVPVEERITYLNDLPHWVIGLKIQHDNLTTGETVSKDVYDLAKVTLSQRWSFGRLVKSYTFDGQGQLASFTDGNNHATTLGNYKAGIPQTIGYPDNTSHQLVVDGMGRITQVVDQAGNTTQYSYDAMGRMTRIDYPSGDEVAWYPKTYAYDYMTGAERSIGAGHWRRTMTKGNAVTVTYFDAMLRPVLTDSYISGDASSHSNVRSDFDWRGQNTFTSYPVGGTLDLSAITTGTTSTYDLLGRVTRTQQASELGALITATAYLSGARSQVTDPKGFVTTRSFQVFDQPDYDKVTQVSAPEGITQVINRDLYGNPLSLTQSGFYGAESDSVTKTLAYDSYHRLCRRFEPESGSEVTAYDNADNVAWTASGLTISGTGCGQEQVATTARTTRSYDAMNRLLTLAPPAGTQSSTFGYDALGNKNLATSGVSQWTANHNKLGLIIDETLNVFGNGSNRLAYGHDAYGSVKTITYPDGTSVDYAPDALGRPTQAGSFASGVVYHPDGNIEGFTFGNGKQYLAEENARQLLSNFTYGTSGALNISEDLVYDANGNITNVNDLVDGLRTKTFSYDGLNRLTQAQANGLWGAESYTYDPINNLRSRITAGQAFTYNYDATNRLASIMQGASAVVMLQYDNYGNVINRNGATLNFDAKNQLLGIPGYGTYAYDASGRRVVKTPASGSGSVYYFYNQAGQLLYQFDGSTTKTTAYIYLGKKLIARNEDYRTAVLGNVDGVVVDGSNNASVSGWACSSQITQSINVDLYVGGPYGTGTFLGRYLSNRASEPAVASACSVASGSFRFSLPLSATNRSQYAGQRLYVYGISPVGNGNPLLGNSGNVIMPASPNAPAAPSPVTVTLAGDQSSITVSWPASTGTTAYVVQQSTNGGAWAQVSSGAGTSFILSNPVDGTYAFQVRACSSSDCSLWVVSGSVTVKHIPVAPATITVPGTSSGPINVSWASSAYATSYTLEQSFNGGPWSQVYSNSGTGASLNVGTTGSYSYRVEACNANGCGGFTTSNAVAVTIPPASAPTLSAPSSSTTGAYTVSWTSVGAATSYTLQEQLNGGTWNNVQATSATSWAASGRGTGTYGYRVQACNAGGCGPWSNAGNTAVLLPPSTAPTLSVPVSNTSGSYTVSWTGVATATSYTLQERVNSGGWSTVQANGTTSWSTSGRASGSYGYWVQACNASGCGPWSAVSAVTVLLAPASAPSLTAPGNNANGNYTVSWSAVTDGATYTLQEQLNGGSWAIVQSSASTTWGTSGKGNGAYGYRVQACNATGCGPWSATGTTTVLLPPSSAPSLSVPGDNATGSYAVSWAGVATATSYTLQERVNGGSWSTVQANGTVSWSTSGRVSGSYGYWVQACNASGCGPWSAVGTVTVLLPPGSAPPIYGGGNSTNGNYTISWNGVTDGATYTLQEQVNGGGWTTVQSSSAGSWSASGRGNGTYGYHVQACNASGCGPWSGVATVTVLLPPAPPASVQAPSYIHGVQYYITWAASATATSYNVIRTNLDVPNTIVYTSTTATTVTIPAPGATQSIQWGAQACNASGCSAITNAPNITNTDPPGPIN